MSPAVKVMLKKSRWLSLAFLVPLVLLLTPRAWSADEGFDVEGEVRDTAGKPVADAHVSYSVRPAFVHYKDTHTDAEGRFTLTGIAKDFEETIFVEAKGFGPASRRATPAKGHDAPYLKFILAEGHSATGRVVDAAGNPIEGATVIPMLFEQFPPTPYAFGDRVTTDAEGRFALHDLPAEGVRADVLKQGYAAARTIAILVDGETEVQLSAPGVIKGCVVDEETGRPLDGFSVRLYGRGRYYSTADGAFVLDERGVAVGDAIEVAVTAPGYGETHVRVTAVPRDSTEPPAVVKLGKARFLRGTVTDVRTGAPIAGAHVVLIRADTVPGFLRMDVFEKINEYQDYLLTSSDEAGEFKFALGLEEDRRLSLVARHVGYGPILLAEVPLDEPVAIRLERTGSILCRTTGLAEVEPTTWHVSVSAGPLEVGRASLEPDGTATIANVPAGAARRVYLRSRDRVEMVAHVDVLPGETAEVDFANLPGPCLTGRVTCAGAPVESTSILVHAGPHQWNVGLARTNPEGKYVIRGIDPGHYTVRALNDAFNHAPGAYASTELVMTEEDARLDFSFPGGNITGRLLDTEGEPAAGLHVEAVPVLEPDAPARRVITGCRLDQLSCLVYSNYDIYESRIKEGLRVTRSLGRQSGPPNDAEAAPDGSFRFEYLAPGEYRLRGGRSDGRGDIATATVVLEKDGDSAEVELRMAPPATLRVKVVAADSGKPVAGARTLICAADGVFITSSLPPKEEASEHTSRSTRSDDAVLIEHGGMPPGDYGVWIVTPGYAAQWVAPVETSADPPRRVELQPAGSFRFKLADGALSKGTEAYLVYRITDINGNPVFPGGDALNRGPLESGAVALTGPNADGFLLNILVPGFYTVEWEVQPVSGYDTSFSGKTEAQAWTEIETVITLAR